MSMSSSSGAALAAIVGDDPILRAVLTRAVLVAPTTMPVLVTGESGTGKELLARALHELGPNPGGPFVAVNCGALPRELAESELFGHERGAFTGAAGRRAGWFEEAAGGTLVLDEIGELPLDLQPKLLRVLESGRLRRGGAGAAGCPSICSPSGGGSSNGGGGAGWAARARSRCGRGWWPCPCATSKGRSSGGPFAPISTPGGGESACASRRCASGAVTSR